MAGTITLTVLGRPITFTRTHRIAACLKPGERHPGPCPDLVPDAVSKTGKAIARKKAAPKPKANKARRLNPAQAAAMQQRMLADRPWTESQRQGLHHYSDDGYVLMNGTLRGSAQIADPDPESTKASIRAAYHGLRPIPESIRVFRKARSEKILGLDKRPGGQRQLISGLLALKGRRQQQRGFTSTSIDEFSPEFAHFGDIMLDIEIPAGTPAAYIEQLTENKGEHEFVLVPGMTFEYTGLDLDRRDGLPVLKVKGTPPS